MKRVSYSVVALVLGTLVLFLLSSHGQKQQLQQQQQPSTQVRKGRNLVKVQAAEIEFMYLNVEEANSPPGGDGKYSQIASEDYIYKGNFSAGGIAACMTVTDGKAAENQDIIVDVCQEPSKTDGWRFDSSGLLHTQLDDDFCMQAGRNALPRGGNQVRLFPCDSEHANQKFVMKNGGGGIRPEANQDLCLVWLGVQADLGSDPIVLKNCTTVTAQLDWSFESA